MEVMAAAQHHPVNNDEQAAIVDRVYEKLVVVLSDIWPRRIGNAPPDSMWVIVPIATRIASLMNLSPEVEQLVVTEASMRMFIRLEGDHEAAAIERARRQIRPLYREFRPAYAAVMEAYSGDGQPLTSEILPEEESHGLGQENLPTSGDVNAYHSETSIIEPEVALGFNNMINYVDSVVRLGASESPGGNGNGNDNDNSPPPEATTNTNPPVATTNPSPSSSPNPSSEGGNQSSAASSSSNGAGRIADIARAIVYAFSFAAERVRDNFPNAANIMANIVVILRGVEVVVPMVKHLPPEWAWAVGILSLSIIVISVILVPDVAILVVFVAASGLGAVGSTVGAD